MMAVMLDHLCSTAKGKNFSLKKVFFSAKKQKENLSTGNQMTIIKTYSFEVIDS